MNVLDSPPQLAALILYTRQFSALVDAGVSLMRCFAMLAESIEEPALRAANDDISRRVGAGEHLSQAMRKHPELFPDIYVDFVKAGEIGGVLQESFAYIAEWLERESLARERLRMRAFLLRLASRSADSVLDHAAEERIQAAVERARRVNRAASFCRAFEMCLTAGVSEPLALVTAAALLGQAQAEAIGSRAEGLEAGGRVADLLAAIDDLRPVAVSMVRFGEEHACLDHMLRKAAEFYDAQAAYALDCEAVLPP